MNKNYQMTKPQMTKSEHFQTKTDQPLPTLTRDNKLFCLLLPRTGLLSIPFLPLFIILAFVRAGKLYRLDLEIDEILGAELVWLFWGLNLGTFRDDSMTFYVKKDVENCMMVFLLELLTWDALILIGKRGGSHSFPKILNLLFSR